MKIVDRQAFLAMPEGTVFAKYAPCHFGALMIKGPTLDDDFIAQEIADAVACEDSSEFIEKLELARTEGGAVAMDFDAPAKDGLYDEDQLFAVWERHDVTDLMARLQVALAAAYCSPLNLPDRCEERRKQ